MRLWRSPEPSPRSIWRCAGCIWMRYSGIRWCAGVQLRSADWQADERCCQRQDITQVRIAPDNVDVLVYHVTLDMGPAARSGNLRLFLPLAMLDVICADMNVRAVEVRESEPQDLWKLQMRRAAATSTVLVNAVLHRQSMAVRELMALKAGDLLSIPPGAIGDVSLEISRTGRKARSDRVWTLGGLPGRQGSEVTCAARPACYRPRPARALIYLKAQRHLRNQLRYQLRNLDRNRPALTGRERLCYVRVQRWASSASRRSPMTKGLATK